MKEIQHKDIPKYSSVVFKQQSSGKERTVFIKHEIGKIWLYVSVNSNMVYVDYNEDLKNDDIKYFVN